jgi:hypothetical protein
VNFLILSAKHQYFTGDWDEDVPKWSPNPDDAYHFADKTAALDTMRQHIDADRAAERPISFAGCRAASAVSEAYRTLKRKGHDVKIDGSDVIITIAPTNAAQAKKELPKALYGIKVGLRTPLGQVLR